MHTKRKKFCSTCKENINYVYENMLEEADNYSDCEDDEEDYEIEDDEELEEEIMSGENAINSTGLERIQRTSQTKEEGSDFNPQKLDPNEAFIPEYGFRFILLIKIIK